MEYEKKLWYKIVYYINIYKFESLHFLMRCIFIFLVQKNTIENRKFKFLTIICEIGKKLRNAKLFTSIRFKNFVWHSFWWKNTIKIQEFHFLNKIRVIQKKKLKWKIICLNEVHKFWLENFSTGCIFTALILKILLKIKNSIF